MKSFLVILLFITQSPICFATTIKKRAVIRDEHFNAIIDDVTLDNLITNNSYEGKYFKIVQGRNNSAIRFDDSEELQLRAATTYYHLNKARSYFANIVDAQFVRNLPQIIIRLDLINVFNEIGHFGNDNLDPQFNNALSVPAGAGYPPKEIKPWNPEIWFRPSKEINIKDFKGDIDRGNSVKGSFASFRNQSHMANLESFITSILQGADTSGTQVSNVMRLVGSSILIEVIYQTTDIAVEFFSRKIYRLDSALVPEIIYHEFSHIALSNHLELSHSTPVNEGLADYFAGKIANSKKLATKIKDYNLFNGKEVRKKQQYQMAFEQGDYANADFVFGLLWNVGATVGTDIESKFMYSTASNLETNLSIRDGLLGAILESCKTNCKNQFNDRIRLYKLFDSKNL